MNTQQIIDAAMQLASGIGGDPLKSSVIDGDMTAENLLPLALRHAYKQLLNSGELRVQDVLVEHILELDADGQVDLPAGVFTEYLDQSFLPDFEYSAFLRSLPDYNRNRFDNLLCYYNVNNGVVRSSCDPHEPSRTIALDSDIDVTGTANSDTVSIGQDEAIPGTDEGVRVRITTVAAGVVMDGIATADDVSTFVFLGNVITNFASPATVEIIPVESDLVLRSLTLVNTVLNDQTVTCAGGAFTDADIGRRLHIQITGVDVLDAYIVSINSSTSVEMSAKALSTNAANATADVLYTPFILHAPSVPAIPASAATDIDIPEAARDAVIYALAMALRGELKLVQ